jgi:predicted Zn-dependent protease
MASPPPTQDDLVALAERALSHAGGGDDAQATARWAREFSCTGGDPAVEQGTRVEIAVVADGGTGLATASGLDDEALRRAGSEARERAASRPVVPAPRLGDPSPGRSHSGYDPALPGGDTLATLKEAGADLRCLAEKVAVVSTRGVRAFEQRSASRLAVRREAPDGRSLTLTEGAVGPAGVDARGLAAEADELLGAGAAPAERVAPGEYPVVLAPWAVAEVLRRAAPAFSGRAAGDGPLAGRFGTRIVAPNINLSDSPRFPGTLPRSYDAEGVPRQPVPLIQDGVAHRVVHDSTSAAAAGTASTGHATRPGGLAEPRPEHLVLVGGGAENVPELVAPIAAGLLIAVLTPDDRAHGVWLIDSGRFARPVADLDVTFDPFELLAQVQALAAGQRTIPQNGGATIAPSLRAGGGLRAG